MAKKNVPVVRTGKQTPTYIIGNVDNPVTKGGTALKLYKKTKRKPQPWQELMINQILRVDKKGLYANMKVGYSIPRRNGKGEILTMRELYGLSIGERIMHTAHRTSTSSAASLRLASLLRDMGYKEVVRVKKGEDVKKTYIYSKQFGLERITLLDTNGSVDFRTRTSKGGLGEGFDVLIVDEAQEYTEDQRNTLQYLVSDSKNPQTILCGTPPTRVSSGTVFPKMREDCVHGEVEDTFWAEWSVDQMSDVNNVDIWYDTNPALGYQLDERKIRNEDKKDEIDFNIQRYGLWIQYNQKSAINENEWNELAIETIPERASNKVIGIKYGKDGAHVSVGMAYKTKEGKVFLEALGCRPIRSGNGWILDILSQMDNVENVIVDGSGNKEMLADEMKKAGLKKPILPTTGEVIVANAGFMTALYAGTICHRSQPSVVQIVTNCDKRPIGSSGGFGFKSLKPDIDVVILDCLINAHWGVTEIKEKKKQRVVD